MLYIVSPFIIRIKQIPSRKQDHDHIDFSKDTDYKRGLGI